MIIDDKLLQTLLEEARIAPRLRQSYDLRNSEKDNSQRMLNALLPGTELPIHRHTSSSETVFLLQGRIDEIFYDDEGKEIDRIPLNPKNGMFGVQIPQGRWHTVEVFEPSVIVEMKAGAYQPITHKDILNLQ